MKKRLLLALVLAVFSVATFAGCALEEARTSWVGIDNARREAGLQPFRWDAEMAPFVNSRALQMREERRLSHDGFAAAADQLQARGNYNGELCEIIAWMSVGNTVDATLRGWRESPRHWECAMNPHYTRAALVAVHGYDGGVYSVMWMAP